MKPMLAHRYADAINKITYPCHMQPKLNGVRALWTPKAGFWSREEIQWHPDKLRHLHEELCSIFDGTNPSLDGELYVHGWSLQRINSAVAVNSRVPTEATPRVEYHIFDRAAEGSWVVRTMDVFNIINFANKPHIKTVPSHFIHNAKQSDALYQHYCRLGYEGAMYRLGDCPYTRPKQASATGGFLSDQNNRTWHLIKRKEWLDSEFPVVGIQEGKVTEKGGKYRDSVGAFILGLPDGRTFNAAPAMSDAERLIHYNNPPIGKLATIRYLVLSDEGKPLNPRVLTIRENV